MHNQSLLITLSNAALKNPKVKEAASRLIKSIGALEKELILRSKNYKFRKLINSIGHTVCGKEPTHRRNDDSHTQVPDNISTKKIATDKLESAKISLEHAPIPSASQNRLDAIKRSVLPNNSHRILKCIYDNPGMDALSIAQALTVDDASITKKIIQELCMEGTIFDSEGTYYHITVLMRDSDSDKTNCKSMVYLPVKVTGAIMNILHGKVALLVTGKDKKLTTEDLLELDGKTIQIKDPTKCVGTTLCAACAGTITKKNLHKDQSVVYELNELETHLLEMLTMNSIKSKNFLNIMGSPASKYKSAIKRLRVDGLIITFKDPRWGVSYSITNLGVMLYKQYKDVANQRKSSIYNSHDCADDFVTI